MTITRRSLFDRAAKGSLLVLSYKVGGGSLLLTPAEAHAQDMPLQSLSKRQGRALAVLAEGMVPGAGKAGAVHFVDYQVGIDPNESLLIAKYFGVTPPYLNFYARGVEVAESMAQQQFSKSLAKLSPEQLEKLIASMIPPGTIVEGFPIFLFYMCLRSDAVDVVYGTPEGFARLNMPYLQHIMPPEDWNA